LIGDKLLVITQGSPESPLVKEGQEIASSEPVEMDAIMESLAVTAVNAEIITGQLAEIMIKVNSGNGTLGRLIQDSVIAENLSQTIINLKTSSKGLDENMEAAKHNFLLKGYFNKKEKARLEAEKKAADEKKKADKAAEKAAKKEKKK
jgi:phospholipid/cholesterol/gamma-HCH transport system substrate-binding protein